MDDHRKANGAEETLCRRLESRTQGNLRHGHAPERRDDVPGARGFSTCGSRDSASEPTLIVPAHMLRFLAANCANYANGGVRPIRVIRGSDFGCGSAALSQSKVEL